MNCLQQIIQDGVKNMYRKAYHDILDKSEEDDASLKNLADDHLRRAVELLEEFKKEVRLSIQKQVGKPQPAMTHKKTFDAATQANIQTKTITEPAVQQPTTPVSSKAETIKQSDLSSSELLKISPNNPFLAPAPQITSLNAGCGSLFQFGPLTQPALKPKPHSSNSKPLLFEEPQLSSQSTVFKSGLFSTNQSFEVDKPSIFTSKETAKPANLFSQPQPKPTPVPSSTINPNTSTITVKKMPEPSKEKLPASVPQANKQVPQYPAGGAISPKDDLDNTGMVDMAYIQEQLKLFQPLMNWQQHLQQDNTDLLSDDDDDYEDVDNDQDDEPALNLNAAGQPIAANSQVDPSAAAGGSMTMKEQHAQRVGKYLLDKMTVGRISEFQSTCSTYNPSNYFHVGPRYSMLDFLGALIHVVENSAKVNAYDSNIVKNDKIIEAGNNIITVVVQEAGALKSTIAQYSSSNYFHVGPRRHMFAVTKQLIQIINKLRAKVGPIDL